MAATTYASQNFHKCTNMIKKKEKKKGNKNQSDSLAQHFQRNYVKTGLWFGQSSTEILVLNWKTKTAYLWY